MITLANQTMSKSTLWARRLGMTRPDTQRLWERVWRIVNSSRQASKAEEKTSVSNTLGLNIATATICLSVALRPTFEYCTNNS